MTPPASIDHRRFLEPGLEHLAVFAADGGGQQVVGERQQRDAAQR